MPNYKPSPRSGFPGSGSGGGDDWVGGVYGVLALIAGLVGAVHSLNVGFEWWPQGVMFVGGTFFFWLYAISEGNGCFIMSFLTIAIVGLIGLVAGGGWLSWGWLMVVAIAGFLFFVLPFGSK